MGVRGFKQVVVGDLDEGKVLHSLHVIAKSVATKQHLHCVRRKCLLVKQGVISQHLVSIQSRRSLDLLNQRYH